MVSSVPQSTSTLLFRAICCGFVCSTKHQNAQKLLFEHIGFSTVSHCGVFASSVMCSPPQSTPRAFCVLVLFRYCCGFVWSKKHQHCSFSCNLLWIRLFHKAPKSTSTAFSCNFVPIKCHIVVCSPPQHPRPIVLSCFFVVAVVSCSPQSTNTVFFVHAFKIGHNWKTNIYSK